MRVLKNLALFSCSALVAVSCGSKDEENAKNLPGTYKGECAAITSGSTSAYKQYKAVFAAASSENNTNGTLAFSETYFSDSACATSIMELIQSGTYTIPEKPANSSFPESASLMNQSLTTFSIKSDTETGATIANNLCGSAFGATTGGTISVTATNCSSNAALAAMATASMRYDIFSVDLDNGKVCFGDDSSTNNASSEALRPTTLKTKCLTKQ